MSRPIFSDEAYVLAMIAVKAWGGLPNDELVMSEREAAEWALGIVERCEKVLDLREKQKGEEKAKI